MNREKVAFPQTLFSSFQTACYLLFMTIVRKLCMYVWKLSELQEKRIFFCQPVHTPDLKI